MTSSLRNRNVAVHVTSGTVFASTGDEKSLEFAWYFRGKPWKPISSASKLQILDDPSMVSDESSPQPTPWRTRSPSPAYHFPPGIQCQWLLCVLFIDVTACGSLLAKPQQCRKLMCHMLQFVRQIREISWVAEPIVRSKIDGLPQ